MSSQSEEATRHKLYSSLLEMQDLENAGDLLGYQVRLINDVLFGYATIESVVAAMRDLHNLAKAALTVEPEGEQRGAEPSEVEVLPLESPHLDQPAVVMDTQSSRYRIGRKGSPSE